jgi:hypothetical protein
MSSSPLTAFLIDVSYNNYRAFMGKEFCDTLPITYRNNKRVSNDQFNVPFGNDEPPPDPVIRTTWSSRSFVGAMMNKLNAMYQKHLSYVSQKVIIVIILKVRVHGFSFSASGLRIRSPG